MCIYCGLRYNNATLKRDTRGHRVISSLNQSSGVPYAMKCVTFDSKDTFPPGLGGAVKLVMNIYCIKYYVGKI